MLSFTVFIPLFVVCPDGLAFYPSVRYTIFTFKKERFPMKHALNSTDLRRTNRRLILDAVFRCEATSRSQLARSLHLSKPAISNNLQPLLDLGIIEEIGEGSSGPSGGRKTILLRFNPAHRYILVVSLSFSTPFFALTDLNGTPLRSFHIHLPSGTPIEDCQELVLQNIRSLLSSLEHWPDLISCIAVAAPGVFNAESELISYNMACGGPDWWKLDLKALLSEEFHLPVIVYNGIKSAVLGEWEKGEGQGRENLLYLSVGLGLGAGIILGGKPILGEHFSAGEIYAHLDPSSDAGGARLEESICMDYLERQCLLSPESPFFGAPSVSLEEIIAAYHRSDPLVLRVVRRICHHLAVITYDYASFLAINHVIFGGEYTPFGDCFQEQLLEVYRTSPWPTPDVRISRLGKLADIYGMAHLARERYFRSICS